MNEESLSSTSTFHINTLLSIIEQGGVHVGVKEGNDGEGTKNYHSTLDHDDNDEKNKVKLSDILFEHIRNGNLQAIKNIIQSSSSEQNTLSALYSPNTRSLLYNGRTILQEACIKQQTSIVQLLLCTYFDTSLYHDYRNNKVDDERNDINQQSYISHDTALHYAVIASTTITTKTRTNNNSNDNNNNDNNNDNPIGHSNNRHEAIIKLLLKHGANPNIQNKAGATPLHYVQSKAVAKLLHDYGGCYGYIGADSTIVDCNGCTPAQYIIERIMNYDDADDDDEDNNRKPTSIIGESDEENWKALIQYLKRMEVEDEKKAFQRNLRG